MSAAPGYSSEQFMDHFAFDTLDQAVNAKAGGMVPLACAVLSEDLQKLGAAHGALVGAGVDGWLVTVNGWR